MQVREGFNLRLPLRDPSDMGSFELTRPLRTPPSVVPCEPEHGNSSGMLVGPPQALKDRLCQPSLRATAQPSPLPSGTCNELASTVVLGTHLHPPDDPLLPSSQNNSPAAPVSSPQTDVSLPGEIHRGDLRNK
jgi:hypothetical protein